MVSYNRKRKWTTKRSTPNKKFKKTVHKKKTFKRKNSFKKGCKLTGKARKTGTNHWLSFGKGIVNKKQIGSLKKLERALPDTKNIYNAVTQMVATGGTQNVFYLARQYDDYDIVNYNGATSGQMLKVILKSAHTAITLTNQSNAPVFIELYEITPRRDVSGIANVDDPIALWQNDSGNSTWYGATPFESEQFTTLYKVKRITRLNLSLGETAEHIIHSKPQRIWNTTLNAIRKEEYTAAGAPAAYQTLYKGLSTITMAVVRGCPTDADNTTVGSAATVVDCITATKYCHAQINTVQTAATYVSTVVAAASGHIMDTGTGADTAVGAA